MDKKKLFQILITIVCPLLIGIYVLYSFYIGIKFEHDLIFFLVYYFIFCYIPFIIYMCYFKVGKEKHLYYTIISLSLLILMIVLLLASFIVLLILCFEDIKNFNIKNFVISLFLLTTTIFQLYLFIQSINQSISILSKDDRTSKRTDKFFKLGLKIVTLVSTSIAIFKYFKIISVPQEVVAISFGVTLSFLFIEIFIYNKKAILNFKNIMFD